MPRATTPCLKLTLWTVFNTPIKYLGRGRGAGLSLFCYLYQTLAAGSEHPGSGNGNKCNGEENRRCVARRDISMV